MYNIFIVPSGHNVMIEILRRRGLLREQMHQVSETRGEWMLAYDYEELVMYRLLVLYTFMQEDGVWNYVDVQTGVSPPILPLYALDLVHARFTSLIGAYELGFYSGWQDCKVALRNDRNYEQQHQVVEDWIGTDVAKRTLQLVFCGDFGTAGIPRLLLDVCYHPDMMPWHANPSAVITFLTVDGDIWMTKTLTSEELLLPSTLATLAVHEDIPLLGTLRVKHLIQTTNGAVLHREAYVDLQRGHACVRLRNGRAHCQFLVDCTMDGNVVCY